MRKILITIRLVLISMLANATNQKSQLVLTNADNRIVSVSFDRSPLSVPGRSFVFNDLEPGYHYLYVVGSVHSRLRYSTSEVLFNNYVFVQASSRISASISCNRSFIVQSVIPVCPAPYQYNNFGNAGANSGFHAGYAPMCVVDFNQLQSGVAAKAFDSSRLQIAEQAISANHLSTSQVTALMRLMSFESSRLELAKFAYAHTTDRQNYYRVNDAFSFESSISDLDQFIRNNG